MTDANYQKEQDIIKLTHEWMEAVRKRDFTTLNSILADDFLIAGWLPEGRLGDKRHYIEDCLRPVDLQQPTYSYDQWQFRFCNNIVVANCTLKCHALVGGREWEGTFLITTVWVDSNGCWQVMTCHPSPVVAPARGQAG